jgi:iron complex outermembrane recepter protein
MKNLLAVSLLISLNSLIFGQNTLTGRITDLKSGDAIPGATIYFPDLKKGTFSDKDGYYKMENLPPAVVIIQISFLGYKSVSERIDLSAFSSKDFTLEEAITEINEVVVTGNLRTTEITRSPIPIVTLSHKDLQQNLSTNIIEAISKLPGVNSVTTGPNISKPFIRGLGFNRVLTLFDGIRQEGQQWGDEHGVEVDENVVDRIEIIKGPASLMYGSDALAGVVNLIPAPPVTDSIIKGGVESSYQTNNGQAAISAFLAGNRNGFVYGSTASYKMASNYSNRLDGRVYGTGYRESDISAYIGLNRRWGYSDLNFSVFNDLQEIPDGSRDSVSRKFTKQITESDLFRPIVTDSELNSYSIDIIHQLVRHYRLYSSNNFLFGKSKLGLLVGYQENIRKEFSHPENPEIPGMSLILKTLTYDAKYSAPQFKGIETTIGINGMYQDNLNDGTEFIIPDYRETDIGPFFLFSWTISKLSLSAGLRYDTRIFHNDAMYTRIDPDTGFEGQVNMPDTANSANPFTSFSTTYSGLSASFGFTYNITNRLILKSNVARGFRAPNILEISANGVHPGTLIYQIGNEHFKPEFSLQEDLGISYRWDHISGNIDFFNNDISNYIFNGKLTTSSGADSVIVKGNQTFKFQQSEARINGWEVSLDIHPYDMLHFENSISATYGINKGGNGVVIDDSSHYLPLIPPLHFSSELRARFMNRDRGFSSLYVKIGMDYYASQNRVYSANNTETPTPGYTLFNGGTGAEIRNKNGRTVLNIDILANNIFNIAYQSNLSRLKYFENYPGNPTGRSGIYNEGRNISFKIRIPLSFTN